ncbi:MAG: hypothetical protein GXO86_05000 [Chlorobi bacterium]|nr:hypothetical protein [Chlorobiota bacterium]
MRAYERRKNLKEHWNNDYLNSPEDKPDWYEEVPEQTICLIENCNLSPDSVILNAGGGTTALIEFLLLMGYKTIIKIKTTMAAGNRPNNASSR